MSHGLHVHFVHHRDAEADSSAILPDSHDQVHLLDLHYAGLCGRRDDYAEGWMSHAAGDEA